MRILRIRLWYQEDAKAAQEGGGYCNVFHELSPLEFADELTLPHLAKKAELCSTANLTS
jgi:hypothetical protein